MSPHIIFGFLAALLFCGSARASLTVTVADPKPSGGTLVIKLSMHNTFGKTVESARAVVVFFKDVNGNLGELGSRPFIFHLV